MKKIFFLAVLSLVLNSSAQVDMYLEHTTTSLQQKNRVQIAILFDTSNSMDGLIDQAKSRIWQIVNSVSNLRYNNQAPYIEIALYEYGNDNIPVQNNYVRKIIPLTNDLDLVSQNLFSLKTRGGQEYCGAVISHALLELAWTNNPNDIKMIYIAGNEPFNQGNVLYTNVCQLAAQRDIRVNTIYCGDYQQGVTEFWYDGANKGKGEYSNINSNLQVVHYKSPFDEQINVYNDSINKTYIHYGKDGGTKKRNQESQDQNAAAQSESSKTERAITKSKASYKNSSWDIVDAVEEKTLEISTLKDDELPEELKGKTKIEKEKYINDKKNERTKYQAKISELSVKREEFILNEKSKNTGATESDLGEEIKKNINKVASEKGYTVEKK